MKGAVVRKKARLQAQKSQVQKLQEQLTAAQKIANATEMQIEKHNEQVRRVIKDYSGTPRRKSRQFTLDDHHAQGNTTLEVQQ